MKTKFSTKVLALVLTLALVVPMFVFTTSAEGENTNITFELGADGAASHADGSSKTTYTETVDGYTLSITGGTNMYTGARDAKGNGCIKFGASSKAGSCSFTVPNDVTSVVLYVAKYKTNTTKITVNGTTHTLTKNSDNGEYDAINVDTTTNKTVKFATVSGGLRAMLNKIEYVVSSSEPSTDPTISINAGQNYIDVDGTLTLTAKTENVTEQVVWSSDNTDVATVENGVVTGKAMGTATITAKAGEVSDTFEVTVYPATGTLTIAEALKVCELTGTTNSPYAYTVIGTITKSVYNATYQDWNITITDENETNSILIYGMKNAGELQVGQKIAVAGKLVNYESTTPEFAQGATYELVVDDDETAAVIEKLNAVAAYMSLAYKYNAVTKTETDEIPATTASIVTDILNRGVTGVTGNSYTDWSGKTSNSSAVYAGQSAGGNESIQLRSDTSKNSTEHSGIITTTSGGKVTKITVEWNEKTTNGRTLNVYGKNTAYESPNDLYDTSDTSKQGTLLGTIVYGTDTELTIEGEYTYIGLRSASGAMYLTEINIEWNTGAGAGGTIEETRTEYSDSEFAIKCGVDADLVDIENVESCGIKVTANGKSAYYNEDNANSWTVEDTENGKVYVVVSLGDIIKDLEKLGTEFTVQAYVEVDGVTYVSEQTKTYSVASMINEYYTGEEPITEVGHLYDYLVEKGLIEENA